DIEIDGVDPGPLCEQHRIGRLPNLDRVGAVRYRVAEQARRGGIEHLEGFRIDALPLREPFEDGEIGSALGGGDLPAFEVREHLNVRTVGGHRAPIVEQIEEVADLNALRVAKAKNQHRSAAAYLELTG